MQTINLVQGSAEWHAHRNNYDNASDLPAAAGVSIYKSREQLMTERKTGLTQEVGYTLQVRFDNGHKFEALARPLAEARIGRDIYPVIGTDGMLSASFDGLTMMDDINWEHKTLNDNIRKCETADELDEMYKLQMDQQMLISGAEKTLFSATVWDENDNLLEEKHLWYTTTPERMQRVKDIWAQFHKDEESFVPAVIADKPKAQAIIALPALAIQIRGEVTLSNLPEFKEAATAFITSINTELVTDEDFAQAEANVKFCRDAEDNIEATKKSAIAQTASIDELMRTLDFISDQLRVKRLDLDKKVKSEKENRRLEIVTKARIALGEHFTSLEREIHPIELRTTPTDFAGAIKGKKTLSSMQDAVNSVLANAKIELDATAKDIRAKREWLKANADGYQMLFADTNNIIYKPMDDLQVLVKSRIADHKQKEVEREAAIKAQAEADAKAKVEAERLASADKLITAGDAINESDFNHVFEVKEQETRSEKSIKITRRPALTEIVNLVANEWNVNPDQAYQWLFESFAEAKAA